MPVNVPLSPLPLVGVNEATHGNPCALHTGIAPAGSPPPLLVTVQLPSCCHPLLWLPPSMASRYTFFAPAYPAAKLIGKFTVRLLPAETVPAPAPDIVH